MPVNFRAVQKKNPSNPDLKSKYYPQVKSTGEVTLREVAKEISRICSANELVSLIVIEGLIEVVPKLLGAGKIVRLGEFGSFSISITGEGVETADELKKQHINKTSVKYRPGKVFKQKIATIEFKKND